VGVLEDRSHRSEVYRVKGTDKFVVRTVGKVGRGEYYTTEVEGREAVEALWLKRQQASREVIGIGSGERYIKVPGMKVAEPLRLDALLLRIDALEARFDAHKTHPGQMDLFGGAGVTSGKPGKPCGDGHISADFTCHKGMGNDVSLNSSKPFTSEQREAIAKGIKERFVSVGPTQYNAQDLADCLLKLADRKDGGNAQKLLDFIQAEKPFVNASAYKQGDIEHEATKSLSKTIQQTPEKITKMIEIIKASGIASPERLKILSADQSPFSREAVVALKKTIDIVENGLYYDNRVKRLAAELVEMGSKRSSGGKHRGVIESELELAKKLAAQRAYTILDTAIKDATLPDCSGCYVPSSRHIWIQSKYGGKASTIKPQELDEESYRKDVEDILSESAAKAEPHKGFAGITSKLITQGLSLGSAPGISTHIHELGHLVHFTAAQVGREYVAIEGRERIHRMPRKNPEVNEMITVKRGPSAYAVTNDKEMFAESFIGYIVAPSAMKRLWPKLYDWVDRTLNEATKKAKDLKGLPEGEDWTS